MDTVLRIVGYLLLAVSIAGLVVAVRVLRQEMPVRTKFDVIRLGISLGSALLITMALSVDTPPVLIGAALVAGAAVGFLQGQGMSVRFDGDQVFARRSVLAILAWGSGMIVAQGAGLLNRAGTVSVGLAVAYFSAAMVGGTILGRNQAITKTRIATAPAAAAVTVLFLLVAPFVPGGSGPAHAGTETFDVTLDGPVDVVFAFEEATAVEGSISTDFTLIGRPASLGGSGTPSVSGFTGTISISWQLAELSGTLALTLAEPAVSVSGDVVRMSGTATGAAAYDGTQTDSITSDYEIEWDAATGNFSGSGSLIGDETGDTGDFTFAGTSATVVPPTTTTEPPTTTTASGAREIASGPGIVEVRAEIDIAKKIDLSEIDCGEEGDFFFEECQRFAELTPEEAGFVGVPTNDILFRIPEAGGEVTGDIDVVYEVDYVRLITGFFGESDTEELTAEEQQELDEFVAQGCIVGLSVNGSFTGQYTPADGQIVGTADLQTAMDRIISGCDFPPDPENPDVSFEDELQTEPDETTAEIQATFDGSSINGTLITADGIAVVFGPPSDNEVSAGSAAGASLIGLVGVAGLLGSTMTETGMSTAELTGAMRRDGLSGLDRLSSATEPPPPPPPDLEAPTTTPQGVPDGVEATPSSATPTPAAPDSAPQGPAPSEPDPAPDTRAFKATADVSPDVTADAPESAPPAPEAPATPSVDVSPDVTADAPESAPPAPEAPATPSVDVSPDVTADAPEAPSSPAERPDVTPSAPDAPAVDIAPDVVDFSDSLPGGVGPREAITTVAGSLSEPSAFQAVDIDPQEAVDQLRAAGVGLRDGLNPVSRLSEDVAAAIRENPVAGARGLVGADALDRLLDSDVPVGQGGGPDLFGAADVVVSPEAAGGTGGAGILAGIDLDATGAETIADSSALDTADTGGASANSELLGDIGEDTSELMSDVVEDRSLADRRRPTGPPAGPSWTFHQLDASVAARLGLPAVALPVRAADADAIFGDTVSADRLLNELDDYLAAHPDQADAYGPVAAELAYVVGVTKGAAGNYGEAASHLRVGLQHAPDNLSLLIHYAVALQCLGDFEQSSQIYDRLERDRRLEHNALMKILAARAHAAAGDHDAARRAIEPLAGDVTVESLRNRLS